VIRGVQELIDGLSVSASQAKIVANSKTLHHLLPRLVVPIDRRYSLEFLFGNGQMTVNGRENDIVGVVLPSLANLARVAGDQARTRRGDDFSTSTTKIIDNAIVGYVLAHPKK
jgi:hypothetical protein